MVKPRITYTFDPVDERLIIVEDGKPRGGFSKENAAKIFEQLLDSGAEISIGGTNMKNLKVRKLRALWIRQGIDQFRESILEPYGVKSTTELTESQLDELIRDYSYNSRSDAPHDVRAARSVILKLLSEMNVYDNSGDWKRVNEFLMNKRIAGKLLYQMSVVEMKTLSVKLRAMITKNVQNN